jgi:Na+/proline symporter
MNLDSTNNQEAVTLQVVDEIDKNGEKRRENGNYEEDVLSQLSLVLSGVMDFPIAMAFLTVGILLSVYYSVVPGTTLPAADNEIFGEYIVHEMPVVFRGLIIAGVFATMMGSTSAALNALATSFTKDFYLPYINRQASERQAIRAARIATSVFGVLMIIVAAMAASVS